MSSKPIALGISLGEERALGVSGKGESEAKNIDSLYKEAIKESLRQPLWLRKYRGFWLICGFLGLKEVLLPSGRSIRKSHRPKIIIVLCLPDGDHPESLLSRLSVITILRMLGGTENIQLLELSTVAPSFFTCSP